MPKADKISCPMCGTPMNHHADKLDYGAALAEPQAADPTFGGVLQETHTCPNCGHTLFHKAT